MWNLLSRVAAAEAELGEVRRLLRDAVEGLQVGDLVGGDLCLAPFFSRA